MAGVERVVVACRDRFPQVAGRGIAMLEKSGIPVEIGMREDDALMLYHGFFMRVEYGRPLVRADGRRRGFDAELTATTLETAKAEILAHGAAGRNRVRIAPGHPLAGQDWTTVFVD